MSESYEFEAKTKDDAVRKACEELGVSEDELEVEVLTLGSTGIFGLVGAKKAKIKVVVPGDAVQESPEEESPEEERPEEKEETASVAETARKTLEDILGHISDDATVSVAESTDGDISLRIEASNGTRVMLPDTRTGPLCLATTCSPSCHSRLSSGFRAPSHTVCPRDRRARAKLG